MILKIYKIQVMKEFKDEGHLYLLFTDNIFFNNDKTNISIEDGNNIITNETDECNNENNHASINNAIFRNVVDESLLGKKKRHTKYHKDNVLRTVQVHFLTFIVKFCNDILKHYGIKGKFYHINYDLKKNISKKVFNSLKQKNIANILIQELSRKYSVKFDKDRYINKKFYDKIIKNNNIKEILGENYINLFKNVYYENKREINTKSGDSIILSEDVETFKDILNKNDGDDKYKDLLINIVKEFYLRDPNKPHFITIKNRQ